MRFKDMELDEIKKKELDEIKKLVREGKFGAITLDTSVFKAQGLRLESGLLKQLEQFYGNHFVKLILSQIVREEVISHLIEEITNVQKDINKSLKEAKECCKINDQEIEKVNELVFKKREVKEIVLNRFNKFAASTSLKIVKAQDYVIVSELIEKYFEAKPPFSKIGKKKCEFPDAIALMSLDGWASKKRTKVIVVTLDNDWKNFCKISKNLVAIDDFAGALGLFQLQDADAICEHLSEAYHQNELFNVETAIATAVENRMNELEVVPEVSSAYIYEHESTEVILKDFKFKTLEFPNLIFRPVNFDNGDLVAESQLSVDVIITCEFSYSARDPIDKDYILVGSSSKSIQTTLDVDVLISFVGNLDKMGAAIDVDNIELDVMVNSVDFGMIEPDWMSEDEDWDC